MEEFFLIRLAKVKSLVNKGLHSLNYNLGRLHGIEQAAWISELGIATVLDIGANVGQFTASIRKVLPKARIYAFEPLEECFTVLSHNTRKDALIQCLPWALGSEDGSVLFNKNDFSPSSSLLPLASTHMAEFPRAAKVSETNVEVRRLDAIAPTLDLAEPLLVKMDVQGSELQVIEGGRETLRHTDIVVTEILLAKLYEGQPFFDDLYRELRRLGLHFC